MSKTDATTTATEGLNLKGIKELTRISTQRDRSLEFAGILVREDSEALYIADPQGTWQIDRNDIINIEDWENAKLILSESMRRVGKPVVVSVREDAIIYEIRPWRINKKPGGMGGNEMRQVLDGIFTLGGASLPISERTQLGENQVAELERIFSRRIGWFPDSHAQDRPRASGQSKTIVVTDGYCDTDCAF